MELDSAARLVRDALARYGIDPAADVEFVKYRENHVFRVTASDGGCYAVRLHRPGYHDDDEIRTELRYLDALSEAGVPVPRVRRADDGELVSVVAAAGHARLVSVQEWIADATPFGDIEGALSGSHDPHADAFAEIGTVIGRLHAAAGRIGTPEGFRRPAWDADGLAGDRPLWGDPTALAGLSPDARRAISRGRDHVQGTLSALDRSREVFGVIHADATPENVMLTPAGVVLIDFDDFGTGWYAFDLVTAVFHHARNPRYLEFEYAVQSGYAQSRPLAAEELAVWDDLMLARGLTYLGWAAQRPADPASEFIAAFVAPWVADVAGALTAGEPAPWRTSPHRSETHR
ncbi:phosphotransferase enzyme family protein [Microbacterium sp. RD1]|uniref:phosphotransferase enzyme family protein n=1 Tax=Microbacterium sp. RD1 TaxID=3457313 RepID=UPI003FA58EC1